MSYESDVKPIKLGYLFDFKLPDGFPQEQRDDLMLPFRMVFADGLAQGLIDRPVEIVFREVEGLPKGSVKAVIDAFGELVDEGCLAVFGPAITDNAVPTREAIERRFQVPAISVCGAEEWLGEWTFALPQGSMTDEPIYWADLLAERGHTAVGVLIEGSLIGESYAAQLPQGVRDARDPGRRGGTHRADRAGRRRRGAARARRAGDRARALRLRLRPRAGEPGAARARVGSAPGHGHRVRERVDQPGHVAGHRRVDRSRPVRRGQSRSASSSSTASRPRPVVVREYCAPVVNRDLATVFLHAFADAHPLTPRGVQEALERVKMLPAASGAPGTYLSFGKWTRRGWMGAGYLVARELDPDGVTSRLVGRFGTDVSGNSARGFGIRRTTTGAR